MKVVVNQDSKFSLPKPDIGGSMKLTFFFVCLFKLPPQTETRSNLIKLDGLLKLFPLDVTETGVLLLCW